ncbi:MAG: class I SAM-dependent methyltransferase [Kiritimatiellae bacterium]|nr:class I SAM-dependent methyltransferase [Kiritimatiellia bacterium]
MNECCRICGANEWTIAYEGPVRHGVAERSIEAVVYQCGQCGVQYLPPFGHLDGYYRSGAYREDVGEAADVDDYFKRHDAEQMPKYGLLQRFALRGRVVADIGCGGGSFLDGLKGIAEASIAIEPAEAYHASLRQRGHMVYSDVGDALAKWRGGVHLAVCFSVIEHVEEPVRFLRQIGGLLAEDGRLLISTPNRDDILLETGCVAYRRFFYRVAHLHYFDRRALGFAVQAAGFRSFEPQYRHRFNFANFVQWLRDGTPGGNEASTPLGSGFDAFWQAALQDKGAADYLYAWAGEWRAS